MKNFNNITNHLGFIYSFPIRIGGIVIAMIGVAALLTRDWGILVGIILILVGAYFATASAGIIVNMKEKAVFNYTGIMGYRKGSWKEYPTYRYICVIRREMKRKKFYEGDGADDDASYKFEIYLVSSSFRGKALLEIAYNREDAEFRAKRYAEEMNVSVTEYESPERIRKRRNPENDHKNKA